MREGSSLRGLRGVSAKGKLSSENWGWAQEHLEICPRI